MGATPHKAVTSRFPQPGENRTSEAPGVVFDPTLGGESVETPSPNDSSIASLSPQVGGRLCSFRRDWQTIKCSSEVLNIITNGYVLPFLSKPNLVRFPLILSEYKAHQKTKHGEWLSSIDLSDAYLHIPIHPNSRFCHRSQVFQFTSLPFRLSTGPQVFTMIVKEVKLMTLPGGLRLHHCLDDWLIRSHSQEEAPVNTQAVVDCGSRSPCP